MFTTAGGGALYTRTLGNEVPPTLITGTYLGAPHLYRIDWNADSVAFSIDDRLVATHASIDAPLSPGASDFTFGGGSVSVDWVRMSPYASSSTFISRVLDAGGQTAWGGMAWTSTTPTGTFITISVRTGDSPIPDGTWTSFAPMAISGAAIGGRSRYFQYIPVFRASKPFPRPVLSAAS